MLYKSPGLLAYRQKITPSHADFGWENATLKKGGQFGGMVRDAFRAVTLKRTWVRLRPCQAGTPVYMLHSSTPAGRIPAVAEKLQDGRY